MLIGKTSYRNLAFFSKLILTCGETKQNLQLSLKLTTQSFNRKLLDNGQFKLIELEKLSSIVSMFSFTELVFAISNHLFDETDLNNRMVKHVRKCLALGYINSKLEYETEVISGVQKRKIIYNKNLKEVGSVDIGWTDFIDIT
jgi:hypothetical protein